MKRIIIIILASCFFIASIAYGSEEPRGLEAALAARKQSGSNSNTTTEFSSIDDMQDDLETSMQSVIKDEIKKDFYWKVEFEDINLVLESEKEIKTVQIHLSWDVDNSTSQTKKMLEMFSNDLAITLYEKYAKDYTFDELWFMWEDSYITSFGNAAKYKYDIKSGKGVKCLDSYGTLYGKN